CFSSIACAACLKSSMICSYSMMTRRTGDAPRTSASRYAARGLTMLEARGRTRSRGCVRRSSGRRGRTTDRQTRGPKVRQHFLQEQGVGFQVRIDLGKQSGQLLLLCREAVLQIADLLAQGRLLTAVAVEIDVDDAFGRIGQVCQVVVEILGKAGS